MLELLLKIDSSSFQCHKKVLYDAKNYEFVLGISRLRNQTSEKKVDCTKNMCIKRTDGKYPINFSNKPIEVIL